MTKNHKISHKKVVQDIPVFSDLFCWDESLTVAEALFGTNVLVQSRKLGSQMDRAHLQAILQSKWPVVSDTAALREIAAMVFYFVHRIRPPRECAREERAMRNAFKALQAAKDSLIASQDAVADADHELRAASIVLEDPAKYGSTQEDAEQAHRNAQQAALRAAQLVNLRKVAVANAEGEFARAVEAYCYCTGQSTI